MTSRSSPGNAKKRRGRPERSPARAGDRFATRHRAWEDAVAKLRMTIDRLKDAPAPMGNAWRDNQVAYFEQRLSELQAAEPQRK